LRIKLRALAQGSCSCENLPNQKKRDRACCTAKSCKGDGELAFRWVLALYVVERINWKGLKAVDGKFAGTEIS
jgi:hypothetical protein